MSEMALMTLEDGRTISVHRPAACAGEFCALHNPSKHVMRDFRLHWRSDRRIFERICPHGVGHPDPDQVEYWFKEGGKQRVDTEMVHGCDGCCSVE